MIMYGKIVNVWSYSKFRLLIFISFKYYSLNSKEIGDVFTGASKALPLLIARRGTYIPADCGELYCF